MTLGDKGFDRRKFLQSLGLALGGTVLSGETVAAATVSATRGRALPSYRFVPIFSASEQQYSLTQVTRLMPRISIDDRGEVYFTAQNNRGSEGKPGKGLYRLQVKFPAATVTDSATIVELGQTAGSTHPVDRIGAFDVNARGELLVLLEGPDAVSRIYSHQENGGLQLLLAPGMPIMGNIGTLGANFRFLDLLDDGRLLFVAHYYVADPKVIAPSHSGLFFLSPKPGSMPQLIWKTGDPIPALRAITSAIGVVDANERGDYALQLHVSGQGELPITPGAPPPPPDTAIIVGNYLHPGKVRLAAASAGLRPPHGIPVGNTSFNPRIGDDGKVAFVLHHGTMGQSSYYGDVPTHQTGDSTPGGGIVEEVMGPPIPADRGLVFYNVQTTTHTHELVISDGNRARTILKTGDSIGGKTLQNMAFGCHSSQVDPSGRIVLLAHFTDKTEAIVVGVPA